MTSSTDTDKDGLSDLAEYAADTSPLNPAERLAITAFFPTRSVSPFLTDLTWTSRPTRRYDIQSNTTLTAPWQPASLNIVPAGGATTFQSFPSGSRPARNFFRVMSKLPLAP